MIVAGTRKGLLMVEGEANLLTESEVLEALKLAHKSFLPVIEAQEDIRSKVAKEKRIFTPPKVDESTSNKESKTLQKTR